MKVFLLLGALVWMPLHMWTPCQAAAQEHVFRVGIAKNHGLESNEKVLWYSPDLHTTYMEDPRIEAPREYGDLTIDGKLNGIPKNLVIQMPRHFLDHADKGTLAQSIVGRNGLMQNLLSAANIVILLNEDAVKSGNISPEDVSISVVAPSGTKFPQMSPYYFGRVGLDEIFNDLENYTSSKPSAFEPAELSLRVFDKFFSKNIASLTCVVPMNSIFDRP